MIADMGMVRSAVLWARRRYFGAAPRLDQFRLSRAEAEARRTGAAIEDIFFSGRGLPVDKWFHYLPIYERFFAPYRGAGVTMLEIGVFKGGSLDMWRAYFGPDAMIYGIDIDPACAERVTPPNQVRVGSQDDPAFLDDVLKECGAPDIVLDDGSHVSRHQEASFRHLWPHLRDGGLYIIEDTHTSYWRRWRGGYRRRGTAIELAKDLIDDMHGWYHFRRARRAAKEDIAAVHVYDSMVVIEKRRHPAPGCIEIAPAP